MINTLVMEIWELEKFLQTELWRLLLEMAILVLAQMELMLSILVLEMFYI